MEFMNENRSYYTINHLKEAFDKAGFRINGRPISKMWIYRQEQKGNLKIPRSTTNFKKAQGSRKSAGVRLLTEQQIQEIVEAFLPGGKGYWSYE